MFLRALKTNIREAFESGFGTGYQGLKPAYIGLDYPMSETQWPGLYITAHPDPVELAGIGAEGSLMTTAIINDAPYAWEALRQGYFEARVTVQILALTSGECDQLWDHVAELILFGAIGPSPQNSFLATLNNSDLIAITALDAKVEPTGAVFGVSAPPWDSENLGYEASMTFSMNGNFIVDIYSQKLLPLSSIQVFERFDSQGPLPPDGEGAWITSQ